MDKKPERADALRNRARVLAAAESAIASKGTGVSTEEIARAAGVGVGTLFRHFPTKESLIAAVLERHLERLADAADTSAHAEEPGQAFFALFRLLVSEARLKNALLAALGGAGHGPPLNGDASTRLRRALGDLLRDAQAAGTVRSDLGLTDVMALLIAVSHGVEHATTRSAQTRIIDVILEGIRSTTGV